ncbi:hypothetical protein T01_12781 [Trichinella spiralis]|uniref:Uncharacterized protein n=1 Tax=Trichinella spiralis TaxID=6334 RepID=A0A0V1AXI7_TRISP|nr:hypothetical protein T01_12781 [Trichinella spiralis]
MPLKLKQSGKDLVYNRDVEFKKKRKTSPVAAFLPALEFSIGPSPPTFDENFLLNHSSRVISSCIELSNRRNKRNQITNNRIINRSDEFA